MKVDAAVLDILKQSTPTEDTLELPANIERSLYVKVAKTVEAMGGKWNGKSHFFTYYDPAEALESVLETSEVTSEKQQFQFFATPEDVIGMLYPHVADKIDIGTRILEPSAGEAAIAGMLRGCWGNLINLDVCEFNKRMRERLVKQGYNVVAEDFLSYYPDVPYDVIIANPPFTKNQDIEHVTHMIECLRDGGVLASVMSDGVRWKTDKKTKAFRELIEKHGGEFERVPAGAFKDSGTNISSCIVWLCKDGSKEDKIIPQLMQTTVLAER